VIYEAFVLNIFAMRLVFITKEGKLHLLASVAASLLNSTLLHTVVITRKTYAAFAHTFEILVTLFSWSVPQQFLLPRVDWQKLTTVHPLLLPL
jgi:predicted tellurium resistance membrane protein TerC